LGFAILDETAEFMINETLLLMAFETPPTMYRNFREIGDT